MMKRSTILLFCLLVLYSGGRMVTVTGSNFLSVQQPEFHLSDEKRHYSSYVSATNVLKRDDYCSLTVLIIFGCYIF